MEKNHETPITYDQPYWGNLSYTKKLLVLKPNGWKNISVFEIIIGDICIININQYCCPNIRGELIKMTPIKIISRVIDINRHLMINSTFANYKITFETIAFKNLKNSYDFDKLLNPGEKIILILGKALITSSKLGDEDIEKYYIDSYFIVNKMSEESRRKYEC